MAVHRTDERKLLRRARAGSTESLDVLFRQYYRNIYHIAFRITGNPEDAEDVTQDALLKAYCNFAQFRGNSRFYTWLVRIAVNEALMKLRRARCHQQVSLEEHREAAETLHPAPREVEDHSSNPEQLYKQSELGRILRKSLQGLGPRLSSAFVLRNVEGHSAIEVAQILGLSLPAVKSRLLRARLKLQRRLMVALRCASLAEHDAERIALRLLST